MNILLLAETIGPYDMTPFQWSSGMATACLIGLCAIIGGIFLISSILREATNAHVGGFWLVTFLIGAGLVGALILPKVMKEMDNKEPQRIYYYER